MASQKLRNKGYSETEMMSAILTESLLPSLKKQTADLLLSFFFFFHEDKVMDNKMIFLYF